MAQEITREAFEATLSALRPKLHRYCARMTGSVFDGEDVVQEALGKAFVGFDEGARPDRLEAWLMRIAHNAAIDFLRRRARQEQPLGEGIAERLADPASTPEETQIAASSMKAFLALPVAQRSCVVLMDLLGYSLEEIGDMLQYTVASVKASLHRGRERLKAVAELAQDEAPAPLTPAQKGLFRSYVDRFNARDFNAIRDMLAEEVWLDMVARSRMKGPDEIAGRYLVNYGEAQDWRFAVGVVDGRPALVAHDPADPSQRVSYFVELDWEGDRLTRIRDYRYARYVTEGAAVHLLD
jgi:RNA polymerase sigma-70 factor, ECF subfamily